MLLPCLEPRPGIRYQHGVHSPVGLRLIRAESVQGCLVLQAANQFPLDHRICVQRPLVDQLEAHSSWGTLGSRLGWHRCGMEFVLHDRLCRQPRSVEASPLHSDPRSSRRSWLEVRAIDPDVAFGPVRGYRLAIVQPSIRRRAIAQLQQ